MPERLHTVIMRMLGGDLIQPELGIAQPAPGRALVCPDTGASGGRVVTGVGVRLVNDDGVTVTHRLGMLSASADIPAVSDGASIIVVLASHPGDIRTAIDVGRVSGWIPIALSPESDYARTGYAIGIGISAT